MKEGRNGLKDGEEQDIRDHSLKGVESPLTKTGGNVDAIPAASKLGPDSRRLEMTAGGEKTEERRTEGKRAPPERACEKKAMQSLRLFIRQRHLEDNENGRRSKDVRTG